MAGASRRLGRSVRQVDLRCGVGDLGELVGGQLDGDGDVVAVIVQADGELGDLEQPAQQRLRRVSEVECQVGNASSRAISVSLGRLGLVWSAVSSCVMVASALVLGFQVVVGAA